MMLGATVVPKNAESFRVGALFTGGEYLSEDWKTCNTVFNVDRSLVGDRTQHRYSQFHRVPWRKVPAADVVFVKQPSSDRLREAWIKEMCVYRHD